VPIPSTALFGLDALLSIVQMPKGIPVATFAVGKPGAGNAALFAAAIVGQTYPDVMTRLRAWREEQARTLIAAQVVD
jgi:5-(carboxyamino)imidazole ribonucleotide mutase